MKNIEEKKYPTIEEENGYGAIVAAEPAVAYAIPYSRQKGKVPFDYPVGYDPEIGPYTIEEMNARIDKAEQDENNPAKWIRVDDFRTSMKREHSWL